MYIYNEKVLSPPETLIAKIQAPPLPSFNGLLPNNMDIQNVIKDGPKPLFLESSLHIEAEDMSDIPNKGRHVTPAFKNKEVINFFEDVAEDISMLKEILNDRPDDTTLNHTDNCRKSRPDGSTECANNTSLLFCKHNHDGPLVMFNDMDSAASLDVSMHADEHYALTKCKGTNIPYHKSATKQLEMTRKLFQPQMGRRVT